jgi:hypothetical protein
MYLAEFPRHRIRSDLEKSKIVGYSCSGVAEYFASLNTKFFECVIESFRKYTLWSSRFQGRISYTKYIKLCTSMMGPIVPK